jgi:hypothetical protein
MPRLKDDCSIYSIRNARIANIVRQKNIALNSPNEFKRLKNLFNDLVKLGNFPANDARGVIRYSVKFFDILSFFQDDGYVQYLPDDLAEYVDTINEVIKNCGRFPGQPRWNPTNTGEKVTIDNMILGGIFSLPIKPARYWLNCSKSYTLTIDYHCPAIPKSKLPTKMTLAQLSALIKDDKPVSADVVKSEKVWATDALVFYGPYCLARVVATNGAAIIDALRKLFYPEER